VFPMYCPPGRDRVNPAWSTYHSRRAIITSECPPLWGATDGTAGPLFCNDGRPNPAAIRYFQPLGLGTLDALGRTAKLRAVEKALCSAERQGSIPIASQEYDLAAKIQGWDFDLSDRDVFETLETC
jgi:hypothetical protein